MSDSHDTAPKGGKKKGRSKLLMFGVPLFVLLAAGGGGGWWYYTQAAAAEKPEAEAEPKTAGMLTLSNLIINLADPGGRKYLRTTIVLLVPDEHTAKQITDNKLALSRLRSAVLEVLASQQSSQLILAEGRAELKKAVAETAKQVTKVDVRDVLFDEFIVQ